VLIHVRNELQGCFSCDCLCVSGNFTPQPREESPANFTTMTSPELIALAASIKTTRDTYASSIRATKRNGSGANFDAMNLAAKDARVAYRAFWKFVDDNGISTEVAASLVA
jgi:hypothetical protein